MMGIALVIGILLCVIGGIFLYMAYDAQDCRIDMGVISFLCGGLGLILVLCGLILAGPPLYSFVSKINITYQAK